MFESVPSEDIARSRPLHRVLFMPKHPHRERGYMGIRRGGRKGKGMPVDLDNAGHNAYSAAIALTVSTLVIVQLPGINAIDELEELSENLRSQSRCTTLCASSSS